MESSHTQSTLVGIFDPAGGLGQKASRLVRSALAPQDAVQLIEGLHYTCGRVEGSVGAPRRDAATKGGVVGWIIGAEYSVGEAAAEERLTRDFRRDGVATLDALRGDFVVAAWDDTRRAGFLAQDQLGGRSLYYAVQGGHLHFATDVVVLLRLLHQLPEPDLLTLAHRVANSEPPPERTVYEGVRRLCAGHALEIDRRGWRRRRYWAPEYRPPSRVSVADVQAGLWESVSAAVSTRVARGGDVGIVMSGGLDSTVVAAAARTAQGTEALRGYSAVFPGQAELDESDRIDQLTGHLGLPSIQVEPRLGGVIALMLTYLERWKTPLLGPGYLIEKPLLDRAAKDGTVALLDGQGGDEVFGHSPLLLADHIRRGRLLSSLRLARRFPSRVDSPPLRASLRLWQRFGLEHAMPSRFHRTRSQARRKFWLDVLSPEAAAMVEDSHQEYAWHRDRSVPQWWAFKSFHLAESRERLGLPEYLRHRAVMSGMEARPPLLDLDLVNFVLSYPPEFDIDRYSRPMVRGALSGRVPDCLRLERRKSNLAPFYHRGWTGPELPVARALLLDPTAAIRPLLRGGAATELLRSPPRRGDPGWIAFGPRVWGLLTVECFLRFHRDPDFGKRLRSSGSLPQPGADLISRN